MQKASHPKTNIRFPSEGTQDRLAIKTREVGVPLEDAAILAVAAKVSAQSNLSLNDADEAVLAALLRAHPSAGETREELGHWLAGMNDAQLQGVVSNTKGVLHEMRFVELENADGDTIYAAQFAATNHAGFDVIFSDNASGADWIGQLKATESEAYVREWLERYPDGHILVTTEIAERMDLESSGISNAELTVDTEQLVDQLISADQSDTLWDYVPGLTALSITAVVYEMYERLERGEINRDQFTWMAGKATGKTAARVVLLTAALSIPVINVAVGLGLIMNILNSSGMIERFGAWIDRARAVMTALEAYRSAAYSERLAVEYALESARQDRDVEMMLERKGAEFRVAYMRAKEKFGDDFFDDLNGEEDQEVLDYIDPTPLIPPEHHDFEVEQLIREKINEMELERANLFKQATAALKDPKLAPHFSQHIESYAGEEGGKRLLAAIMA